MPLRNKMLWVNGISFLLFLIALAVAIYGIERAKSSFTQFVDTEQALLVAENEMYTQGLQIGLELRNLVINPDDQLAKNNLAQSNQAFDAAHQTALELGQSDPTLTEILTAIGMLRQSQKAVQEQVLELASSGHTESAAELFASQETLTCRSIRAILLDSNVKLVEQTNNTKHDVTDLANKFHLGSGLSDLFALVASALMLAWLMRNIIRKLGGDPAYATMVSSEIAHGNFTTHIQLRRNDESSLLFAMQMMQRNIAKTVQRIRDAAAQVDQAAEEIAVGNHDLSERTENQATSLEQTAAAMQELSSTVENNAEHAQQANQLATRAANIAEEGGQAVHTVVGTMDSIKESSAKIVDIISVIDSIAFQTNILALNAAVEAARAGEQGRGFAVVATEVRTLAQRSAAAAQEIKTLIDDSVERVNQGDQQAAQASQTITDVVTAIREVAVIMNEITVATQEQSAGIHQVDEAIGHLDTVTQQNATLVEQAARAADSLQQQAHSLAITMNQFRLPDSLTIDAQQYQDVSESVNELTHDTAPRHLTHQNLDYNS